MDTINEVNETTRAFEFISKVIELTETAFAIQCTQKLLLFFKEKYGDLQTTKNYTEQLTNKLIDKIPAIIIKLEIDNLR